MIRPLRSLLLVAMALLIFGAPALAQTPDASPASTPAPLTLDGLQEGVTRQYSPDPTSNPADNPDTFSIVTVHIFRFDTSEHAAATWQSLRESAVHQFQTAGSEPIDVHEEEIGDLGDQAYVAWLSASPQEGLTGHYRVLYVQDGEYLYLLTALGSNEDATLRADELTRVIVDRGPGSGAVSFHADGTSTGGLWDLFPPSDDDVLESLVPVQDREVTVP